MEKCEKYSSHERYSSDIQGIEVTTFTLFFKHLAWHDMRHDIDTSRVNPQEFSDHASPSGLQQGVKDYVLRIDDIGQGIPA